MTIITDLQGGEGADKNHVADYYTYKKKIYNNE